MTLKEFETLLKEDPILLQKFKEAKEAVSGEDAKNKGTALCGIIQNLGYDVSADEITLGLIGEQSFDENELEAVAGGLLSGSCGAIEIDITEKQKRKKAWIKATIRNTSQCENDFTDTDCWSNDFCDIGHNSYGWDKV